LQIAFPELVSYVHTALLVVLAVYAIFEHIKRKNQAQVVLGFLHGIKPSIVSASKGEPIPRSTWEGALEKIHDMMERLQPPKKP
jgi:hypothetical protein